MLINDKSILMNSKKLSQSSNNVANPVVIIPNQSNLLIDDLLNNNSLLDNGNKIEQEMSEIKYMKGYVNVLRERFTRKSLGTDAESYQDRQKGRVLTSSNSEGYRRRSVSPFVSTTSQLNHSNPAKLASKENKQFASQDDLRSPRAQGQKFVSKNLSHSNLLDDTQSVIKCTYLNEINQDELPKPNFVSSVKNLFEKQIKNENLAHFANHQNEKKEKNSPNKQLLIVSNQQAESLVEKLKQNGAVVYQHDTSSPNNQQTICDTEFAQTELKAASGSSESAKKDCKPAKTHSKKHLSNATNLNLSPSAHPPSNGLDKENKSLNSISEDSGSVLSFKERKELFSKKQQTSNSVNHNYHSSSHQINVNSKRFKTEYSYSTPIEQEPKCNSISNDITNANSNNNNSGSPAESTQNDSDRIETFTADKILEQQKQKLKSKSSVKMKTYYGGQEVKDLKSLNLCFLTPSQNDKPMQINPVHQPTRVVQAQSSPAANCSSLEYFKFEFIGAGVKLDKSILIVNNQSTHIQLKSKKNASLKVNFTEEPQTYEYPSFEYVLKEMGFDPLADEDDESNNQTETESQSSSTSSLSQFLPGRFSFDDDPGIEVDNVSDVLSTNIFDSNPTNFTKLGSGFNNFKPSWHRNYELGSMEHLNLKSDGGRNSVETSSSESLTNDILPSKDDELKKWSSDMDSNILF